MRIQTSKKALASALTRLARIIPSKSTNPLLTAVHAQVTPGGLLLSGTNLEVDLRLAVLADVGLDGHGTRFSVGAHLWHQAAAKLPAELVELELIGQTLHMRAGGSHAKLQLVDSEDAPPLAFPEHGAGMPLPDRELLTGLRSVLYAVAPNAFQAVMRGVLIRMEPTRTRVVTSDGYRFAVRESAAFPGLEAPRDLLVPQRNAQELAGLLDGEGACELHLGDGLLSVTREGATLNVKLMEGEFPDWERVIPKMLLLTARVSRAALAEATDRVSLFADKNANNRLELLFGDGRVRLLAEGDYGTSEDIVEAELSGTESTMACAVNAKHLLDAVGQMGTVSAGEVVLELSGSATPMKVTTPADPGQLAVFVTLRA